MLRESWTRSSAEETLEVTHVVEMRDHLEEMSDLVKKNAEKAQWRQKAAYDQGTKPRSLEVGDDVLVVAANAT